MNLKKNVYDWHISGPGLCTAFEWLSFAHQSWHDNSKMLLFWICTKDKESCWASCIKAIFRKRKLSFSRWIYRKVAVCWNSNFLPQFFMHNESLKSNLKQEWFTQNDLSQSLSYCHLLSLCVLTTTGVQLLMCQYLYHVPNCWTVPFSDKNHYNMGL